MKVRLRRLWKCAVALSNGHIFIQNERLGGIKAAAELLYVSD